MDQKELKTGDGPIGLILAPTRELAQQVRINIFDFYKFLTFSVNKTINF